MDKSGCKLGMKIRRTESFNDLDEGVYTIRCFQGANAISLEEVPGIYLLKNFEKANKFEVGDEVNYKIACAKGNGFESKIFGVESKNNKPIYAIKSEFKNGDDFVVFANEKELSPLKKSDELEPGDKFKAMDSTFEVVAVGEDSELGTVYFSKSLGMKTMYYIICWEKIDKIIY